MMREDLVIIIWTTLGIFYLLHLVNGALNQSFYIEKRRFLKVLKRYCNVEEMNEIKKDLEKIDLFEHQYIFLETVLREKEKAVDEKLKKLIVKYENKKVNSIEYHCALLEKALQKKEKANEAEKELKELVEKFKKKEMSEEELEKELKELVKKWKREEISEEELKKEIKNYR